MKRDHEGTARAEVDDTARRAAQHPYGVQPSAANETETAEHRQLVLLLKNQHTLDCLDDALLLAALGWLDAPSLCFMGATSRRLYCIAHASMLWRDLTLRVHGGAFSFKRNWRETCTGHPHAPLPSCGRGVVFSDELFDPWYQAAGLRVEPRWLERSNIDRRSMDQLGVEEFARDYDRPGVPCIVTDCIPKWKGSTEWTRERLLARFPERQFRVSATVDMRLTDFFDYCDRGAGDERPLYLFDKVRAGSATASAEPRGRLARPRR
jgi:hypothetical protein